MVPASMMMVDSRKGGHALNLQILFHVLKIICLLLIVGTWIWLLIYFFPVIRTILHMIFFPPKLSPVDPADIPPEGSLSLSVFPCRNHPILSDRRASAYVAYVLERNWVDEQLPDLTTLGDAIIAELCGSTQMESGFPSLRESCDELFFSFAYGFQKDIPESSFDFSFCLYGDSDDYFQILCNRHTSVSSPIEEVVSRLCAGQNIPIYPPVDQI